VTSNTNRPSPPKAMASINCAMSFLGKASALCSKNSPVTPCATGRRVATCRSTQCSCSNFWCCRSSTCSVTVPPKSKSSTAPASRAKKRFYVRPSITSRGRFVKSVRCKRGRRDPCDVFLGQDLLSPLFPHLAPAGSSRGALIRESAYRNARDSGSTKSG
jgi:hypothetical protein